MAIKVKHPSTIEITTLQRCQCGWLGSNPQAAIWLRKDQTISRICPHCGTPSPLLHNLVAAPQQSQSLVVH